jgi:hypothetical protein
MTTAAPKQKLYTPRGRVSFPFTEPGKPQPPMKGQENEGKKPKWGAVLVFDKDAVKTPEFLKMIATAREAAVKKFGADKLKLDNRPGVLPLPDGKPWYLGLKCPFRQNEEKDLDGYKQYPGGYFVSLSTQSCPGVVNAAKQQLTGHNGPGADGFYPGCYARATYSCYGFDTAGNKGVAFGVGNFQKLGEGANLSGREEATRAFDDVSSNAALTYDVLPEDSGDVLQ